jgi:hypothetical protein
VISTAITKLPLPDFPWWQFDPNGISQWIQEVPR